MGGNNSTPQAPAQSYSSNATPDSQTNQMIANMQAMKDSGVFDTPYQKAMKNHPILMGVGNAMQAFGQGLTKQPYYTSNQDNQASLQNTQLSGINQINTLPAQMRMMMMMNGVTAANNPGQIPGAPPPVAGAPSALPSVIATPRSSTQPVQDPMLAKITAAKAAGYSDSDIQAYLSGRK